MAEEELRVPEELDAPWLTKKYVKENGLYLVPEDWLKTQPPGIQYKEIEEFGDIPWSADELKPGDIIIFDTYGERMIDRKYKTDRFLRVTEEVIKESKYGGRTSHPNGIVVTPPAIAN